MIKLLVVEDETATRKGLMKHIKWSDLGVDVVEEAVDGIEGLEVASLLHPDIVISDIRMPGMNGIEFTTNLREQFPECKIIYLSGYSDKEYLKAAIRLSAVSYVEKPIQIDELQQVIVQAVHLCRENQKIKETVREVDMALSGSLPFIRQKIVDGLIHNQLDENELLRILSLAHISFDSSSSYTVSILVPSYEENATVDNRQSYCNAIIAFLNELKDGFMHLAVMKDTTQIIVLSAHKPGNRRDFPSIYHLLIEHLKNNSFSCSGLSWVVGSASSVLSKISDSYQSAAGFLQQLFYYDLGNIFYSDSNSGSVYTGHAEIMNAYTKLLQEPQKDEITSFTEHFCNVIRTKTATPVEDVKNLFYQMLRMLKEQGEKRGLRLKITDDEKEEYDWAMMSKINSLSQLKAYFLRQATIILDSIEHIASNSRAVLDVIKFIRVNYSDKDISVNMLADHVHLTPTYLSSLFRKETGKTISEYITEVRIENSAVLLMEPRSKLDEVADRSGYNDANYFSKAFKKLKGMTPSQFRRKHKS